MKYLLIISAAIFLLIKGTFCRFGPKKLYTLELPTNIVSVKVINNQLYFIGSYYIGVIDNAHWKFRAKRRMTPRVVNSDIPNPRAIGKIPARTFSGGNGRANYWIASWGTNTTDGAISVMQRTSVYSTVVGISLDSGWNYEHTQWVDMDFDGLKDCLTARYRGGVGQMLWFKQPPGQTLWGQKIIHEGLADGNFMGFLYDRKTYILVAGNQFNSLGLYWTLNRRNNWSISRQIRQRILDNYGRYYDVQYIDLNKDGRKDVLTTTVQIENSRGQVLGYEIPRDIQNADWTRRVLAAGFTGDYSPGQARAFWPNKRKQRNERPSIFLSGGGEGKIFILTPVPKSRGWGYVKSSLAVGAGVVGVPFVGDLDRDKYPEVIVPQENKVHVYSYDYSASAAAPPRQETPARATVRPVVPYRNPYARGTRPPPTPAIPADQPPVGPNPDTIRTPNPAPNRPIPGLPRLPVANPAPPNPNPAPPNPNPAPSIPRNNPVAPAAPVQRAPVIPNPLPPVRNNPPPPVPPFLIPKARPQPPVQNPPQPPARSPAVPATLQPRPQSPVQPVTNRYVAPPALPSPITATPVNSLLRVTEYNVSHWGEARYACSTMGRVLCSLPQLQFAKALNESMAPKQWGWYDDQNRAARIETCQPGQTNWTGYVCYNGAAATTQIFNTASLPALCCGSVNGARYTSLAHSLSTSADADCKEENQHLCTMVEMMKVWDQSTYKGHDWGWFGDGTKLIKMVHRCDPGIVQFPGYRCWYGRLVTQDITSQVQQRAFCCQTSSANLATATLPVALFCLIFSIFMHL
ncbi:uncharacterized protein LOC100176022 isoform X2 [Ciona intestinalis]